MMKLAAALNSEADSLYLNPYVMVPTSHMIDVCFKALFLAIQCKLALTF